MRITKEDIFQYFGFVLLIHMCCLKFLWWLNIFKPTFYSKDNHYKWFIVPVLKNNSQ